jgi:hypothetical protein
MNRLFLWLAIIAADFAVMAAIIWIERTFSVPRPAWLRDGNFLAFGTLLIAVDVGIYIPINRRYGLLHRRKPSTLELFLRVGWYLCVMVFGTVIGSQSGALMGRFLAFILAGSGSLSMYASVQDVVKRYRQRWT